MAKMDVGNGLRPAWRNMVRVLFRPFSLTKWLSLGFISLIAYCGQGGFHANLPGNWSDGGHTDWPSNPIPWIMEYWPLLLLGFLILMAISLLISWVASVLHFVYVDDIVRSSAAIKEPWARLRSRGTSYFLWRLVFGFLYLIVFLIVVGTPVIWAFTIAHGAHNALKVLAIVWAVLTAIPLFVIGVLIDLFVRDFVTTAMYAKGVGIMEGWRIAWPLIKENAGQVALYVLILIALSFAIGMFGLIVFFGLLMVVGIPIGVLVAVAIFAGKEMGLEWSAPVIAIAVSLGVLFLMGFTYLVNTATQPADVFRRSYALAVMGQADPSLETLPQS